MKKKENTTQSLQQKRSKQKILKKKQTFDSAKKWKQRHTHTHTHLKRKRKRKRKLSDNTAPWWCMTKATITITATKCFLFIWLTQ